MLCDLKFTDVKYGKRSLNMKTQSLNKQESGNVLFLILIAVALFAALSYAVTQSSRGGGSDATSETAAVNSASLTQYPTGIRTALLRMSVAGVGIADTEFNAPADFANCSAPAGASANARCVFHPNGGGASSQQSPGSAMAAATAGTWYFNSNQAITEVGTTAADYVAWLPGITQGLCTELNKRYTITGIPTLAATAGSINQTRGGGTGYVDTAANTTGDVAAVAQATAWPGALDGHPFGCFQDTTATQFVYYHTVSEQ